jgi:hypothetical protein
MRSFASIPSSIGSEASGVRKGWLLLLTIAALVCSAALALAANSSTRITAQAAPGGTQVSAPDANGVVTITVPVDLTLVGKSTLTAADRTRVHGQELAVNRAIGGLNGFSGFKYTCGGKTYTFNVKAKFTALPDSDGPEGVPAEGHHWIQVVDDPSVRSITNIYDPVKMAANGGQGDPTIDSTKPYQGYTDGTWDWNSGYQGWTHEIGHLLGLGDDYTFVGVDQNGDPIPAPIIRDGSNRQGTLMDTAPLRFGQRLHIDYDQQLIDRLGNLLAKAGKLDCRRYFNYTGTTSQGQAIKVGVYNYSASQTEVDVEAVDTQWTCDPNGNKTIGLHSLIFFVPPIGADGKISIHTSLATGETDDFSGQISGDRQTLTGSYHVNESPIGEYCDTGNITYSATLTSSY